MTKTTKSKLNKSRFSKNYVADFEIELLSDEQIKDGAQTYVWAWSFCDCDDIDNTFNYGTSIDSFFDFIKDCRNHSIIWFHNLKFDGQFILSYLLRNGWTQKEDNKELNDCEFCATANSSGVFYSIEIKYYGKNIKFYDSLKKLPFKVEKIAKDLGFEQQKGSIDYKKHREEGGELTEEEIEYIKNDVQIVARALKKVFFDRGLYGQTIGSDCLRLYKEMTPNFFDLFPKISDEIYNLMLPAYQAGTVIVNKKKAGKIIRKKGVCFDINSLHPYTLDTFRFPVGEPIYFKGGYEYDPRYKLYIQHFKCTCKLKKGKLPCVHVSNHGLYRDYDFLENSEFEKVELTLSNIDLELFFDHYEVKNLEVIDGVKFEARKGMFSNYISYWYNLKKKATEEKNAVERMLSKLFLNNLAGKFAQKAIASIQMFSLDENEIVKSKAVSKKKDTLYLPITIFVCSYSRKVLFETVDKAYSEGCFLYCDTDSCFVDDVNFKPDNVDDFELGAWKLDKVFDESVFVRAKTYAYKNSNGWNIVGCGMNEAVKDNIKEEINNKGIECFKINAEFNGKISTKHVKGGVVLTDTTFKIRK